MKTDMHLHPDIVKSEAKIGRETVDVIHPSTGLLGGEPDDLLFTIVYQCPDGINCFTIKEEIHTHWALYGPKIISFPDSCKICNRHKWHCTKENHEYEPIGYEVIDETHFELYAD